MTMTDYYRNKILDMEFRGVAYSPPAAKYVALFKASAGQSPRSAAVTTGQTTVPATLNGHMYRCTTAGTTGSGEPSWPTTSGGTVTDGTAVWTEMLPDFRGNTGNLTEVSGGAYARFNLAPSAANWSSTGGAGTTTNPSAGTNGTTSNNSAITFPVATTSNGLAAFFGIFDASSGGNMSHFGQLNGLQLLNTGATASFATSQLVISLDN